MRHASKEGTPCREATRAARIFLAPPVLPIYSKIDYTGPATGKPIAAGTAPRTGARAGVQI